MSKLRLAFIAVIAALGLMFGAGPAQAAYNYQGPKTCYPLSGTSTYFKATSWNNSSTSKTYHFAVREDSSLSGSAFRYVRMPAFDSIIRYSSPNDSNPLEWYFDLNRGGNYWFTAYFYDFVGGVPTRTVTCSLYL